MNNRKIFNVIILCVIIFIFLQIHFIYLLCFSKIQRVYSSQEENISAHKFSESEKNIRPDFVETILKKQEKHTNFYFAGPDSPQQIALTFDDGPSYKYTPIILDILEEYDVKATFFMLGKQIKKNPNLAARAAQKGHLIGNHTYSHERMKNLSSQEILDKEIEPTGKLIKKYTGQKTNLIRPPYGDIKEIQINFLSEKGYYIINWSLDLRDWDSCYNKPKIMLDRTAKYIHSGAILLLHDGGGDRSLTVEVLPDLIEFLRENNYVFVTVNELIEEINR